MNTTNKIRKGSFVKVNVPIKRYGTLADTLPADNVYQVTYASRNGNDIRIYGKDLIGSRNVKLSDVTVVDVPRPVVNVGDIFVSCGGYEQTNVQFYVVRSVNQSSLTVERISAERKYTEPMCGTAIPILSQFEDKNNQQRVNLKTTSEGTACFKAIWGHAFPYKGDGCFFSEWH